MASSAQTTPAPFHHTFSMWHKLSNELKCRVLLLLLLSTDHQRTQQICQVGRYSAVLSTLITAYWSSLDEPVFADASESLSTVLIGLHSPAPLQLRYVLTPLVKRCTQVSKQFSSLFEIALRDYIKLAKQDVLTAVECTHLDEEPPPLEPITQAAFGHLPPVPFFPSGELCGCCKAYEKSLKPELDASDHRAEACKTAERIQRLLTARNKGTEDEMYRADRLLYETDGTLAAFGSARWGLNRRWWFSDEEVASMAMMATVLERPPHDILRRVIELQRQGDGGASEALIALEAQGYDAWMRDSSAYDGFRNDGENQDCEVNMEGVVA